MNDKIYKGNGGEENAVIVGKDYEKAVCTTSSIASWLIKSVIFTLLFLIFR